ncbi:hypothetical protein SUGI_0634040 [Cryptomeria japonica]|nr:hypothetical protein SUGI_0634040 [Cryptomeria japonica]
MERSYDSFWKWGSARKKMAFSEVSSLEGRPCSMPDKAISVADGFSLKIPKKGSLLNRRHCKGVASIPRSHKIAEVNASKFGSACSGLALPIESSSVEVNLPNSKYKNSEANRINSPISVVPALNVFSSLQASTSDADTISCNPHDDLSSQALYYSDAKLFEGGNFCEREESSKLRARRMDQKASYDEGIRNTYKSCKRISFREDPLYCSISDEEDEGMQLRQWSIDEETRNLKPVGVSEATSNHMDESCKKPKSYHSPIPNRCHEIQEENPEAFAALNLLAVVAVRVLENRNKGEDKSKVSRGQWKIFHPSEAPSSHKIVMKRAKSDSNSLPPQLPAHANKLFPSLTEHHFTSKLGSPGNSLKREHDQDIYQGFDDKNEGENLNVRSSKRSRSQYLNCKYPDSVLEPLKKGTRR